MLQPSTSILQSSQLDVSLHTLAVLDLVNIPINRALLEYVVRYTIETVEQAISQSPNFVPLSPTGTKHRDAERASFLKFATQVLHRAAVKVPVILGTLVYMHRARRYLDIANDHWAYERTFLGALILSNKFLNDSTLKNIHWAKCSGVFRIRDIGRIEREFLDVLDYNLAFDESDVLLHYSSIMSQPLPPTASSSSHRKPVPQWYSRSASWDSDSTMDSDNSASDTVDHPMSPQTPPTGYPLERVVARVDSSDDCNLHPYSHSDLSHQKSSSRSHRITESAIQILRSIPMPNFHNHHSNNDHPPHKQMHQLDSDLESAYDESCSSSSTDNSSRSPSFALPPLKIPGNNNHPPPLPKRPPHFHQTTHVP